MPQRENPTPFKGGSVKVIIQVLIVIFLLPSAHALGIAYSRAAFSDNTLNMSVNGQKEFRFILQNSDDVSKKMKFKVSSVYPMTVNNQIDPVFEQDYNLSAKSNQEVIVRFYAPNFDAKFPVTYSYQEVPSGSGNINIVQEVSSKFYMQVGTCTNCTYEGFGMPLNYPTFNIRPNKDSKNLNLVKDLTFYGINGTADVYFYNTINLSGFTNNVVSISYNRVYIDSDSMQVFRNATAKITFYNLSYNATPKILKNGYLCTDCEIVSYSSGTLVFKVKGFSEYRTVDAITNVSSVSGVSGAATATSASTSQGNDVSPVEAPVSTPVTTPTVADILEQKKKEQEAAVVKAAQDAQKETVVAPADKDAARELLSALAWGFLTLLGSVTLLYNFVKNNETEVSYIIGGG